MTSREIAGRQPSDRDRATGRRSPPQRCFTAQGRPNQVPFNIGPLELIVVLLIALVVLGAKSRRVARQGLMREFKDSLSNAPTTTKSSQIS